MMTPNRMKMLARMQQQDSTTQDLADAAGVAFQTAWRWLEQQLDLGNVVVVIRGKNGHTATRFGWIGGSEEQGRTLLYRAADYLALRAPDDHGRRLKQEIAAWLARDDGMPANAEVRGPTAALSPAAPSRLTGYARRPK